MENKHWASVWGNAISIGENRPESYNKNLTIRYPVYTQFGGSSMRLTYDNSCGTDDVTLTKTTVQINGKFYPVTFGGKREAFINIGIGYGIRLKLPMIKAPLKLDVAYPILRNQDNVKRKFRVHFNVGFTF